MALQALWAPETQFQNKNGSILVNGKIYIQYRGRSQLARTYRDQDGTYTNPNPLLTDNDGRVLCFADDSFSYTAVVCDFYGNELFSFDPIPCGSGSSGSAGSSAQHWIGINGQTQQVSRNTYTRLRLPSGLDNVDYDGDFVLGTIKGSGTEMVLKDGLYLVNAVIRFKQSSDDLTNTLSNVIIHTRDFDLTNIQEVGAIVRDETGPDASDDIHTITLTYIRHVSEDDVGSDRIKFAVETPNTWSECYIQNLQIAKLGSGGSSSEMTPYEAGDYISIENGIISVTGIDPDSYATQEDIDASIQSATSAFLTSADLDGYATEEYVDEMVSAHSGSNIVIGYENEGILDSGYDGIKIVNGSTGNEHIDLHKDDAWYNHGMLVPSAPGADKILTTNSAGKEIWDLKSYYAMKSDLEGLASEEWVENYTSAFITSADIPDVPDDLVTSSELAQVSGTIEQDLADVTSAITEALADKMDKSQSADFYPMATNPSGYLVESDLNGYATETWVTDQNYITSADIPPIPEDVVTSGELATVSGEIVNQIPSLQGYATEEYVQNYTSAFITSADLPDVSDMATKTWVEEQGYLTSIPSEYVTDSELESAISEKADTSAIPDVSNFVTQEDIDRSVSGKMDSSEASAFYPMATNPSGYLVSSDLNGYATETYVQNYTSAFITSADIPAPIEYSAGENIDISDNVISVSGTAGLIAGDNISITPSGDNYVISSSGSGGSVTFPLEVSGSTRVYEAIDGLTSAHAEAGEIEVGYHDTEGEPDIDTVKITPYMIEVKADWGGSYPTITQIAPNYIEFYNDQGSSQSVDSYSIEIWNNVSNAVNSYSSNWNSATSALNASAALWNSAASTQSDWNEADSASLAFIKNKPEIPSLSGYATETWVSDGFMETSGIEYNSQDEISAYNGHPIMTVDSEKQWLTHDDTIAHVTNSAQYAFGVNVPVVARAMGTDETVLFNNTNPGSSIVLSEVVTNFERIRITWEHNYNSGTIVNHPVFEYEIPSSELFAYGGRTGGGGFVWFITSWTVGSDNKTISRNVSKYIPITTSVGAPVDNVNLYPIKIVGIGRKEN